MKAFLIDPLAKAITEVDHDGSLESIYKHTQCDIVERVLLDYSRDVIFVDEEGLFKNGTTGFFSVSFRRPLAGRGLVLGHDGNGNSVEPKITIEALTALVRFL